MKSCFTFIAAAALVCPLLSQQKGAPADMATDLKQAYNGGKNKIIAAAEQMPEAGYAFKPTPEVRNFGQWVGHVADEQFQWCGAVTGNVKQVDVASKTTKADLLATLRDSFAVCDPAYEGTTMANRDEPVPTFRGPRPRASWLYFNVAHNEESYGTMAVYLRLQQIVPPSTAGKGKGKAK